MKEINLKINKYNETLNTVVEKSKSIFKDNLLNITLGGSGGKNNLICDWSDLDLYYIFKEYNDKQVKIFLDELSKFDIHIGTTFYTVHDIEKKSFDFKTYVMIYEKFKFNVNPSIYGNNYFKDDISFDCIKKNDRNNLYNVLQVLKRQVITLENNQNLDTLQKTIKKLTVALKCILSQHDIFVFGYADVFNKFNELCLEKEIDAFKNFDVIQVINNPLKYIDDVVIYITNIFKVIDNSNLLNS